MARPKITSRMETVTAYRMDWHNYLQSTPCDAPAKCRKASHWNTYEEEHWQKTLPEAQRWARDDDSPAVRIIRVSRQVIIEESAEEIEVIDLMV